MIAYHGDPSIKDRYLKRVRDHADADRLIQNVGWNGDERRGCAVGCTLEAYDHSLYPIELGVPEPLAHLEDGLFETITPTEAQLWPERFLEAIPVGADLTGVWTAWALWMLLDEQHGVIRHADGRSDVEAAIRQVAALFQSPPISHVAAAAARAAANAAVRTAYARAADAAANAAEAAAAAADADTNDAVRAASAAYATACAIATWSESRATWSSHAADKLVELLKASPIP